MSYSPHTAADRATMLAAIGVTSIEALFADVPASVRFPKLDLPGPLSELEALQELERASRAGEALSAEVAPRAGDASSA